MIVRLRVSQWIDHSLDIRLSGFFIDIIWEQEPDHVVTDWSVEKPTKVHLQNHVLFPFRRLFRKESEFDWNAD